MEILLNTQQRKAITYGNGPLLIIAGAGTGKTTVVTERIKYIILKKRVKPDNVLGLTFTEKAAREMEERVDREMPYGYTQMWISTFHSFCDRILRNDAIQIGLSPSYILYTEAEMLQFFKTHLYSFSLDYFRPFGNPTKFLSALITHFSRLKDEDITSQEYEKWVQKKQKALSKTSSKEQKVEVAKWKELAYVYKQYEMMKKKEGIMDFSDLISNTLLLFRKRPNVLHFYQKKFRYILVDEFQDTNIAQYELIKLLAPSSKNPNLTVVGDDFQSIYKFRGAAVSNILSFMNDYSQAVHIVLTKNYRSSQTILDHSYKLMQYNNPDTLEVKMNITKKLKKMRETKEYPIEFYYSNRVEEEAEYVADCIQKLHQNTLENYQWKDFAILVRANNHADAFVRALSRKAIPYQFLGPGRLFHQPEIKDLICYLKVLANYEDSISFYRVLTMPQFHIEGRDIALLINYAKKHNCSLFEAAEQISGVVENGSLKDDEEQLVFSTFKDKKTVSTIEHIVKMIHRHLNLISKETAGQILYYFLEDTGMVQQLITVHTVQDEKRVQNIARLFDKLKQFEIEHEDASVFAVVDWLDISMELGESPLAGEIDWIEDDAVRILTVHSSKGLEFPVVFLVNLVSGRFPTYERREKIPIPEELIKEVLPEGDYHIEEERRLFYVGTTRARDRLFLSASKYYGEGKRIRKLSPFVRELLGNEVEEKIANKDKLEQIALPLPYQVVRKEEEKKVSQRKVTYLSYSQIETFQFCPMHYKARYILKLPTPSYPAQTFGKVLHQTMYYFYQDVKEHGTLSKSTLFSIYEKLWNSKGYSTKREEQTMKKLGKKYLENYFTSQIKKDNIPKHLEKKFIFPIHKRLKFGGIVDRVDVLPDGTIEIIDYKTSHKIPTQKEADKNLQLTLYALAASEVYEIGEGRDPQDILLSLYFFSENVKISTTRTRADLYKVKQKVIEIAEQIEKSDFACSGVKWCKKCEFKMLCDAKRYHMS